ncbi:hypothetical protein U5903_22145 [Cereibacter johrii]|uniref:hypothetical protein n=1 Tax=Cereibacter johrii TaxID=445629 RepID=UPI002B1F1F7C|nr:hypothetical protein [Cereibacter johrii]MEA5163482.1 hypothetical protein [Cereibacter johrii]
MSYHFYMRGMSNGGAAYSRGDQPLTNDELKARVPSIFATEAHESRSARFAQRSPSAAQILIIFSPHVHSVLLWWCCAYATA